MIHMKLTPILANIRAAWFAFPWRFATQWKQPLGRWALEYNTDRLNKKIDYSNEDHCGTCHTEKTK